MFRRTIPAALALSLFAAGCGPDDEAHDAPALVVLVTVDQLRGDLIERFEPVFEGGFRRLLDEGYIFGSASHNHSSTSTAIGHATLATGLLPARHGLIGNSWVESIADGSFRDVYAVEDSLSPILDYPSAPGRSPRNMHGSGLADWLLEASPESRTLAVSTKDRAAITTAGQSPDHHVYWWMSSDGGYATSAYYRTDYPDWVQRFNRERVPELIADSVWEHTVSAEWHDLARPDEAAYEADGRNTTFTHYRSDEVITDALSARNNWWRSTPFADRATWEFAREAMGQLELGTRGVTDYLSIAFSATDYVGHKYGPLSQEQLANLESLDEVLGELFTALDETVGEGRWVLAFSADHGVVTIPEYRPDMGEAGYRTSAADRRLLAETVETTAARVASEGGDTLAMRRAIAAAVETLPFVADVMVPEDELLRPEEPADSFVALFRRSYTPGRHQGIEEWDLPLRATEGTYISSSPTGTGHGSAYWYDRWVPIVFMGAGVEPGRSDAGVFTTDVAPTLASLAGLTAPSGLDGRVLDLSRTP